MADVDEKDEQEVRVRIGPKPTYSTEHGVEIDSGRLSVNTVLDVDPVTARRWVKRGIAKLEDGVPFEVADRPFETVQALNAQIAQLQAQLAAAQSAGQTAGSISGERAQGPQPVNNPGYIGRHSFASDRDANPFLDQTPAPVNQPAPVNDLTSGRAAVGEDKDAPADEDDEAEDDTTPPRTRVRRGGRK